MSLFIQPMDHNRPEWVRRCATAVNSLLSQRGLPFPLFAAAPADPVVGQGYYDTVTNKARIWNGTIWNDLW